MTFMVKTFRIFKMHLMKSLGTVQFWVPFVLALGAVNSSSEALSKITAHFHAPINAFSASFLLSGKITAFTIFLGVFILFSELPFRDNNQTFQLVRGGKRPWIFGQFLYIIAISFMYFAFVFAAYCAVLFPRLDFSMKSWGKIVNTIAATNVSNTYGLRLLMPQNVLSEFSPIEAFGISFALAVLISITLGVIILTFNLIVKHNSGLIISGFFIFLYLFLSYVNAISEVMFYFSPLGWCSLILLDKNGSSPLPSAEYAIVALGLALTAMLVALWVYGSKRVKFVFDLKGD